MILLQIGLLAVAIRRVSLDKSALFHSCQSRKQEGDKVETTAMEGIGFTEDSKHHANVDNMAPITLNSINT